MMKTILVATNSSSSSNNAIKYAAALAKHTNSNLVLFNSFELSVHASNSLLPASAIDELFTENIARLKAVALQTSKEYGINVKCLTRSTFLEEELECQVERFKADLVVIGLSATSAEHGFEHTATSIIRHAKYPVLAVPDGVLFRGLSRILFAFDPGCIQAANKLPVLMEVAAAFNARVQVCHVEKRGAAMDKSFHQGTVLPAVEKLLTEVDHAYKDIDADDVIKGLQSAIEEFKAELLVMVPHRYGFWEGLFHRSKTNKMTNRTPIPLLALPGAAVV